MFHQWRRLFHHVDVGLFKDDFLAGTLPPGLFTGLLRPANDYALAKRIESITKICRKLLP